jgi:hypothetical protein
MALWLWLGLAASPDAGAPRALLHFEVPHVIEDAAVPERVFSADYPVTIHAVKSTDSAEDLVRFFIAQFAKANLFRMPQADLPEPMRSASLTGLDTSTLIAYTVIFQPNSDRTTTAIMSETYLAERRAPASGQREVAALFPGATEVVRGSSEGLKTVSYRAGAEAAEVERFYQGVLPRAGYREVEPATWVKPGERLQVVVRPLEKAASRVTVIAFGSGG